MPSFQDSIFLFVLALLLFGPKRLPVLARELGKWVGEFRRASNEFKMQMEEELRLSEQADRQQQIAAIEAAAPIAPALEQPEHPHLPATESSPAEAIHAPDNDLYDPYDTEYAESLPAASAEPSPSLTEPSTPPAADLAPSSPEPAASPTVLPIATSGDLNLMPPATGLPTPRSASRANSNPLGGLLDAIPEAHNEAAEAPTPETAAHGRYLRDASELADRARAVVRDRAELPGMSLMEHLDELRKRLFHSLAYLGVGFIVAWIFHTRLVAIIQKPLLDIGLKMTMTHPTDAINFFIKTSLVFGAIFASPFILYQVWLFISPGMYAHEKKYVVPFMAATIALFLSGAWFGYRYVLPGAMVILIQDFGKNFSHMITIDDYTGFFLAVILGLGVTFELPIVIFFLALFGIVDAKFLLRNARYAVLALFLLAAIICPDPSPVGMCLFASPMLALYFIGVAIAFFVHPSHRKKKIASPNT